LRQRARRPPHSRSLEKGAFTGALTTRIGRFELADGGTLFLDEIGDMSLDMQVKLLRVLQERAFERVGSGEQRRANVRILAATHRDLETRARVGEFREDLFLRLNVFPIVVPPLRERNDDLPALIDDLVRRGEAEGQPSIAFSETALDCLVANMGDSPAQGRALYEKLMRVCHRFLGLTPGYFGYVPNDDYIRQSIRRQTTVFEAFPSSPSARAFQRLARVVEGWQVPAHARGGVEFFIERLVQSDRAFLAGVQ
jgi:sigma54-dependent transcription regulator